jgi:hypothetical protein
MSPEEVQVLLAENAALCAEVAGLRQQLAEITQQLQATVARIAELEQGKPEPPSFVKPNRPTTTEPKAPRKKRAPEHNTSRKRSQPTRIVRPVLEHCPDCGYWLRGRVSITREK